MGLPASDRNVLFSMEEVSFNHGSTQVLVNVSVAIERGDFLAIIGPNGSGKTTLLKILLGLLRPQRGRVRILGSDIGTFVKWEKIGYVPQKATNIDSLFPVSVREVVSMGLLSRKRFPRFIRKKDESAIDWALDQVDMRDFKHRRIGELSGGQQQRVFIARAIVNRPLVLFLDEPTTGVDAETQKRFYSMLGSLNKDQQITIVIVTHDLGIVDKRVNKIACVNQKLVFHGNHEDFCNSSVVQELLRGEHHLVCHRH